MFKLKETAFIGVTVFILVSSQASDSTFGLNSVDKKTSSGGSQSKRVHRQEQPIPQVNQDACPIGLTRFAFGVNLYGLIIV